MSEIMDIVEIQNRKHRQQRAVLIFRASVFTVLTVGILIFVVFFRTRQYSGYEVLAETLISGGFSGVVEEDGVLYVYNHDGARALVAKGDNLWQIAYTMRNPKLVGCGEAVAVADIGGTSVCVVDRNGQCFRYEVLYPIVKHEVNGQGVTAVLQDNGTEDYIRMYDKNGTMWVDINTKTKKDGIPVDIALSEDGKQLVTLYVTYEGDAMVCKVTFYHTGDIGKTYVSNIVEQKIYEENRLAYDVGLLGDDILYVLLEDGFSLYRMTDVPELLCEERAKGEIQDVICAENGLYVITQDSAQQSIMTFYDGSGKEKNTWSEIPTYETVTATEEEVLFFSPGRVTVYRTNRFKKFDMTFESNFEAMLPVGGNRYFLVDTSKVQEIKLSNKERNN